ncbi:DegT/DnrJ/EryC1/StrS family aminotransferase [Nonomuraea pusilla]|uniref:dTDP-4-amino-4,6-dideoxygalactose transaminase n=1 Tax=Nonomuraea pusilla TaxID=46177 RepID=A0A1H8I8P1_9ACTN|nr:DegT/DnrJ/EryC1/StrS family aminotransferase [Nonomuraea pusilla]SEN64515.1 dTDP-4-amino-4,6-dideoxygalactose transaminase [Nonomuraea pusilla]
MTASGPGGAARRVAERTGRRCLELPSNRLGLYLALRHWCTPGQRLLMSPISADEILFLVLAAGLRPVIAPLSPRDGNIDAARADLSQVDAVLTTNLYGLPDQVSAFAGKILIEDVAHAMETRVEGRPLGTFGQAGVFSLSKHPAAGSGGVLAVEREDDLRALARARDELLAPGSLRADVMGVATSMARQAALRLDLVRPALRLMRALGMQEEREGYRIALEAEALRVALKQAPALPPLDPWVRADLHDYRCRRGPVARWYQGRRLAKVPRDRARRLAGVALLAGLPTVAPAVRDHVDQPLFRVPLLVADRDTAIAELERRGVATGYLYDPPYDDYAPGFTEPSPDPGPARWWARHVLPVDPLYAARALPVLRDLVPPTRGPREPAAGTP